MGHDTTPTGSTTRLVQENKQKSRCMSFCPCLSTSLVVLSLCFSMGNILRLPRMVIQYGGGCFLIIYIGLCLILGFPLAFLEVVLGQFCQQGTTKLWRAVPLLKGVGFVKVLSSFLIAVYYPAMMAVTLFMALWTIKRPIPFLECNDTMSIGDPADVCLTETILKSPLESTVDSEGIDGYIWFGLLVTLVFLLWAFIMLCICRGGKSVRMSSVLIVFLSLGCLIALLVNDFYNSFKYQIHNITDTDNSTVSYKHYPSNTGYKQLLAIDWTYALNFDTWYYALIQLFFSTQLGFGNITTCAGNIYSKSNAFWTSLFYMFFNVLVGVSFVVIIYMWSGDLASSSSATDLASKYHIDNLTIPELFVNSLIYEESGKHNDLLVWALVAYFLIILAGFASMTAVVYTIVVALAVETKNKWRSWLITVLVCTLSFITGILILLPSDWALVHLFDSVVIGRIVIMTTSLELIGFLWIYGVRNICNDFEFVLGHKLSPLWILIWCLAPVFLVGMEIASIFLLKKSEMDYWLFVTSWSIYGFMWLVILICAVWQISLQVDYNLGQKLVSSLKASRKWGPVDPMYRHGWVQWRDQYQATGERDFTLKRRGTRDYTHSVKTEHRFNTMSLQRTSPAYLVQLPQGFEGKKPEQVGWRKPDNISLEHRHRIKT